MLGYLSADIICSEKRYKRGSDTPSRSYPQKSGRKPTFLGYRGRGSYFHNRQQVGGRSAPIASTKPQKDKV